MTTQEVRRRLRAYRAANTDLPQAIRDARAAGLDITEIAAEAGIARTTVYRALKEPAMRQAVVETTIPDLGGIAGLNTLATEFLGRQVTASQGGRLGAEFVLPEDEGQRLFVYLTSERQRLSHIIYR